MAKQDDHCQPLLQKHAFWRQHVCDWKSSKLSQAEYCRQHGLDQSRFSYWKRRLKPKLLPVAVIRFPERKSGLQLTVDDRYRIEIDEQFSADTLRILLQLLESR